MEDIIKEVMSQLEEDTKGLVVGMDDEDEDNVSETSRYHTTDVDMARKVLGVDPQDDILHNHHFVRVIFKPDNVPTEYRSDLIKIPKEGKMVSCNEHGVVIGNAGTKKAEEMVFQVYRLIGTFDLPLSKKNDYYKNIKSWLLHNNKDFNEDLLEDMVLDYYAFLEMKKPIFIDQLFSTNDIDLREINIRRDFLKTLRTPDGISNLRYLIPKKNPKAGTAKDDNEKSLKKQEAEIKKAEEEKAREDQKKKASRSMTSQMNKLGLYPGNNFVESVKNIIAAYGGDKPIISRMSIPEFKYVPLRNEDEPENWESPEVHSKYFWRRQDCYVKCGKIKEYRMEDKKKVLDREYIPAFTDRAVYSKEKVDKKLIADQRYLMYHDAVKNYIVPHFQKYVKAISMKDRHKEEYVIKELIKAMTKHRSLINDAYEQAIVSSYGDYSVQTKIKSSETVGFLTWNERVKLTKSKNPQKIWETKDAYEARIRSILDKEGERSASINTTIETDKYTIMG